MKAVVSRTYGTPDVLRFENVDKPVPKNGDVLVRNNASVVTAAECAARSGTPYFSRLHFGLRKPKWPVLGANFAGQVDEVGSSVTRFRVGDRVAGVNVKDFGAHAEYLLVPEDGVIALSPTNLTHEQTVAAFDGSLTALPFLRDTAHLQRGQTVLINGASGAVGTAAVQVARFYGATVTAVCSTQNLKLVASLGADTVIGYTTQDFTRTLASYVVIFDAVGKSSFRRCHGILKRGGIYLTTVPTLAILLQTMWTSRFRKKKVGIVFTGLAKPDAMRENLVFLGELADAGILVAVIGMTHSLARTAEAHRYVDTKRKTGSAVITISLSRNPATSTLKDQDL
jgi:NADPH:quinone reductase-like Zn-dependent oxidoreductase